MANPVLVEVWRGPEVESRHRGAAIVMDARGRTAAAWGETGAPVFPRSAVKPLQALVLLESGAADRFAVTDAELALACASHSGEEAHVAAVDAWLARLGLSDDDLECGAHAPLGPDAALAMAMAGGKPRRAHNNCSGKHTGMLAAALALGAATRGYTQPDHPVQKAVAEAMGAMTGALVSAAPMAIDGCGVPTWALSLEELATAFARIAKPSSREAPIARIRRAMAAYPHMVAGTGRFCTRVMEAAGESILVKTGAEGVFAAALPGEGLGIAVKIDDGASRASESAIAALLRAYGRLPRVADDLLAGLAARPVANWAGLRVGEIRPNWLG